jgi:hypothetical protein
MTEQEIAERIQGLIDTHDPSDKDLIEDLRQLRDELDPPNPGPGTVVLWRMDGGEWQTGIVSAHMQIVDAGLDDYEFYEVEWKPARILGPRQVSIDVPPIENWPRDATHIGLYYENGGRLISPLGDITRHEAERMEAGDD